MKPLIIVVGPTASGKTSLAIRLAQQYGGEIICADSRTIYAGMDIGTAKPDLEEQAGIPHWGLDLVEPGERFSVADFQAYAMAKISEIRGRGNLPIVVGGTGLYVDSVAYRYDLAPSDIAFREGLQALSVAELIEYCKTNNINPPEDINNRRRLITAIVNHGKSPSKHALDQHAFIVGIATEKNVLRDRIAERTEYMFEQGVVEEARILGKKYSWDGEAMTGNIYPIIRRHLSGELSLEQAKDIFTTRDQQLAKRQMTWLRRNPDIEWCVLDDAYGYVSHRLATEYDL